MELHSRGGAGQPAGLEHSTDARPMDRGANPEEIERITAPQPQAPSELDWLGTELVARELEMLEIRRQNETLGAQVVGLELRLLSLEGNPSEGGSCMLENDFERLKYYYEKGGRKSPSFDST